MSDEDVLEKLTKAEFYYNRGTAKLHKQDYDGAIVDLTKAIELKPDDHEAYNNRGNAKLKKQDYDGAFTDFDKAIEFKYDYADAFYNRGISKLKQQDYDGAITDFTEAIRFKPNYAEAYSNRGTAKLHKQDYDGAIVDLTKAIKLKPDDAESYTNRGNAKAKKQDYDGAIADFNTALKHTLNTSLKEQIESNKSKAEAQKSQKEFKLSKQEYDKLGQEVRELKTKTEELLSGVTVVTAKRLSDIYKKQSQWQFGFYIGLRLLEAFIYGAIAYFLYTKGFPWLEGLLTNKEITTSQVIFMFIIKVGIFIPVYLLVRLINTTANRFAQRQELDGDTSTQWLFFDKMEIELKNLKDNPIYAELYKDFMEQNIALRHKTNFERIEDIYNNRHNKSVSLKQIDALAETAKKIKDVCITPKEQDDKKEDAKKSQ